MSIGKELNLEYRRSQTIKAIFYIEKLTNDELPFNATTNPYIPLNLTDSVVEMMWRKDSNGDQSGDADGEVILIASSEDENPISNTTLFTIPNPLQGEIKLNIPPAVTEGLFFTGNEVEYGYDIQITDISGNITYPYYGTITLYKDFTRNA